MRTLLLGHSEQAHPIIPPLSDFPSRGRQDEQVSKKIYVGNLPFSSTEEELKDVFGRHGTVEAVNLITVPAGRWLANP